METAIFVRMCGREDTRRISNLKHLQRNKEAVFAGRRNGVPVYVEKRGEVHFWNGSDPNPMAMHVPGEVRS